MSVLEKIVKESDFFYKKENLPKFRVGDTVKVTLYLELPKADETKKGKERIQVYQGVIISTHNNENPTNATITVRKMFQGGGIEKVFLLNSPSLKTSSTFNVSPNWKSLSEFLNSTSLRFGETPARLK